MTELEGMNRLVQGKDFELVPDTVKDDTWAIRLLTGSFPETVIQFGVVKVTEDGEHLSYDFNVLSTPLEGLTPENEELQQISGDVLLSILEESLEKAIEEEKK